MKFSDRLNKVLFEQDQVNPAAQPAAAQPAVAQPATKPEAVTPIPAQGEQKPTEPQKDDEADEMQDKYVTKDQLRLMLQNYLTNEQMEELYVTAEVFKNTLPRYVTRDEWKEGFDDLLG